MVLPVKVFTKICIFARNPKKNPAGSQRRLEGKKKPSPNTKPKKTDDANTTTHTKQPSSHYSASKIESERTPGTRSESEKNNRDEKQRCTSFMQQSHNCPHLPETASTANRVDANPTARLPVHRPPTRAA
jgi:hypothetical protein